jgi:predicted dehydrogenase
MSQLIHWAILGPGKIAEKFASAFSQVPEAKLYAVASRDEQRGKVFAEKFNIAKVYISYEQMLADPLIDIVYIATPHTFHHEQTLLCLKNKKAVVCEKPLTLSTKQTTELVTASRANNTFLMEGMWTRFFPAIIKTLELIQQDAIGEIKFIRADFGFAAPHDPDHRVLNLKLGGGAQLDVGVYPLFLALLIGGTPKTIQAISKLADTGADETTVAQFEFENGAIAHILSSIVTDTPKQAEIFGSKGSIILQTPWHKSQMVTLKKNNGEQESFKFPFEGVGFHYELRHATDCLQRGLKESELMPLSLSIQMAKVADEILQQAGVFYPTAI